MAPAPGSTLGLCQVIEQLDLGGDDESFLQSSYSCIGQRDGS